MPRSIATSTMEDYLKTLFELGGYDITTQALADALEISPASATRMIQKLAGLNLVDYERYQGVSLTESGRKIALETLRHHRLLETYLAQALKLDWHEVHEEAEKLEHVISERLEKRIADVLGDPSFDPHGDPIPRWDGSLPESPGQPLSDFECDQTVTITRVTNQNPDVLRYLESYNLKPGAVVKLVNLAPFQGPVTLEQSDRQVALGFDLAVTIYAQLLEAPQQVA